MGDDLEHSTDASFSLPDCPLCGGAVGVVTIRGPSTAVAAPCGCRAPPEVLLVDPAVATDDTENATADADDATERGSVDPTDDG